MEKHSEADMLAALIPWLEAQGMEVYKEVSNFGGRADLIGVRALDSGGRVLHVYEGKMSLSLAVLEQALWWRHYAHYVSIVTPCLKRAGRGSGLARQIMRENGIGYVEMRLADPFAQHRDPARPAYHVHSFDTARMNRRLVHLPELHEKQKTMGTPGSNRARYWTPFGETVDQLARALVKACPVGEGARLDALVKGLAHHYAHDRSAVGSLRTMIARGVIVGCEVRGGVLVRTGERVGLASDA